MEAEIARLFLCGGCGGNGSVVAAAAATAAAVAAAGAGSSACPGEEDAAVATADVASAIFAVSFALSIQKVVIIHLVNGGFCLP